MKKNFLYPLFFLTLLSSCQTLYTYRLPSESEKKQYGDSLHWGYSGNTIRSIPVVDGNGAMFRLVVTPKTKIEVKTIYGEMYRFFIQTITVSGDEGFIGMTQTWTGYELLNHAQKTILVRDIMQMEILSDEMAVNPIGKP